MMNIEDKRFFDEMSEKYRKRFEEEKRELMHGTEPDPKETFTGLVFRIEKKAGI